MRERPAERSIDVAFVSRGTPVGCERLLQDLRDQGLVPRHQTMVDVASPVPARARLASALLDSGSPAGEATGLAVLDAGLAVSAPPLGAVLDDPRIGTAALAVRAGGGWAGLGVLKVAADDRALAAELLRGPPDPSADLVLDLTRALSGAGVAVRPVPLGGYAWAASRSRDSGAAVPGLDLPALDERRIRLREAARSGDGFYSSFVLRRLSWRLTGLAERAGLTPNQVTLISFGLGLLAAAAIATGSRPWLIAGAVLLQVCLVVDCVDGELARYRRRFSRFGAWLDAGTDRVKEFAAIAALAVAAARTGDDAWRLAAAAIAVQTFRNLVDLAWALQRRAVLAGTEPETALPVRWLAPATDRIDPAGPPAGPGALTWVRRLGHFPIGERFLLISLGAALGAPRGTLVALLAAGLVAAGYLLAAFALRSRPSQSGRTDGLVVLAVADTGPVLAALLRLVTGGRAGRSAALLPAVLAVTELALAWALAVPVAGAPPAAGLGLVAAIAIAHYLRAYSVREGTDRLWFFGSFFGSFFGTDARILLLLVLALALRPAPAGWAAAAVWALAALVAAGSTAASLRAWRSPPAMRSVPAVPTAPTAPTAPAVQTQARP